VIEDIDVSQFTATRKQALAQADAAASSIAGGAKNARTFMPREAPITIKICDPWTGETTRTYVITSRVLEGDEVSRCIRYAAALAGVPMSTLDPDSVAWFKDIARADLQIRAVVGTNWMVDAKPEDRRDAFIALLQSDPALLAATMEGLERHEARFRAGNPREGEGEAKHRRVVLASVGDP
jgi:hypothetical protein